MTRALARSRPAGAAAARVRRAANLPCAMAERGIPENAAMLSIWTGRVYIYSSITIIIIVIVIIIVMAIIIISSSSSSSSSSSII